MQFRSFFTVPFLLATLISGRTLDIRCNNDVEASNISTSALTSSTSIAAKAATKETNTTKSKVSATLVATKTTATSAAGSSPGTARTSNPGSCLEVGGSGEYSTFAAALNGLGSTTSAQCIFLNKGTYREQVTVNYAGELTIYGYTDEQVISVGTREYLANIDASASNSDGNQVTITSGQSSTQAGTLDKSSTVNFISDNVKVYNLNFENTFGTTSQAVAVTANGENQGFYGCQFLGNQDTLYAKAGAQYYKNCYIEGTTDFIFGNAAAWFESSNIAAKKASAITANSREDALDMTWYVFESCKVVAADGFSLTESVSLGRPWRVNARVIYQNSVLSDIILPEGWTTMADNATPTYEEFNNSGPGSDTSSRKFTTEATAAVTQDELWTNTSWVDAAY